MVFPHHEFLTPWACNSQSFFINCLLQYSTECGLMSMLYDTSSFKFQKCDFNNTRYWVSWKHITSTSWAPPLVVNASRLLTRWSYNLWRLIAAFFYMSIVIAEVYSWNSVIKNITFHSTYSETINMKRKEAHTCMSANSYIPIAHMRRFDIRSCPHSLRSPHMPRSQTSSYLTQSLPY